MNAIEFANTLDGATYRNELDKASLEVAKDNGLVVIYGASDDLMEIDGAIRDEADVYDGNAVYIDRKGVHWTPDCETQNCPYYRESLKKCVRVRAVWHGDNKAAPWTYSTTVPHSEFRVYDDGELWCVGIVFSINDIPE